MYYLTIVLFFSFLTSLFVACNNDVASEPKAEEKPPIGLLSGGMGGFGSTPIRTLAEFRDFINEGDYEGNSFNDCLFTLTEDIDLSGEEWIPIGTEDNPFTGTFDGGGHTISNMRISAEGKYGALFNYVGGGAVIKNLTLKNVSVDGCQYTAGFVGYALNESDDEEIILENLILESGTINSKNYSSGICLFPEGYNITISRCVNHAQITSDYSASGLSAWSEGYDSGEILITDCVNTGSISGLNRAGGIVGDLYYSAVKDCLNVGTVTVGEETTSGGTMPAGGIAGITSNYSVIENCTNAGNVINYGNGANSNAGGIVGQIPSSDKQVVIRFCVNTGDVQADVGYAGGIVTAMYGGNIIEYDYNSGSVRANDSNTGSGVFGISGGRYGTAVASYCVNAGTLSEGTYKERSNTAENPTSCYYYNGATLMPEVDVDAALANLNTGLEEPFWGKDSSGVIQPMSMI